MAAPHHVGQSHPCSTRKHYLTATSTSRIGTSSSRLSNLPSVHGLPSSHSLGSVGPELSGTPHLPDPGKRNSRHLDTTKTKSIPKKVLHSSQKAPASLASSATGSLLSNTRSYSEISKNEAHLLQMVETFSGEVQQLKEALTGKDACTEHAEKNAQVLREQLAQLEQSYEAKLQSINHSQSERYQALSDQHSSLLDRTKIYESKLEELHINLLSLQPFHLSAEQEKNLEFVRLEYANLMSHLQDEAQIMQSLLSSLQQQYIDQCLNCQAGQHDQPSIPSVDALIDDARGSLLSEC